MKQLFDKYKSLAQQSDTEGLIFFEDSIEVDAYGPGGSWGDWAYIWMSSGELIAETHNDEFGYTHAKGKQAIYLFDEMSQLNLLPTTISDL